MRTKLARDLARGDIILDPGTGLPAEVWEVQRNDDLGGVWILYGERRPYGRLSIAVPEGTEFNLHQGYLHPMPRTAAAPPELEGWD